MQPQRQRHRDKGQMRCWDLDNTIWEGTLLERRRRNLKPNPEALKLIKKLDERGILQTVVRKTISAMPGDA